MGIKDNEIYLGVTLESYRKAAVNIGNGHIEKQYKTMKLF